MKTNSNKFIFVGALTALLLFAASAFAADAPLRLDWPKLSQAPEGVSASESDSEDAALIVGIQNYAFVSHVEGANRNASDWRTYLREVKKIPLRNVGFLSDTEATAESLRDEAARIAALARPGSTLWFVFIGHGVASANGEEGLLVGADAQGTAKSLDARSVPQSEIESILTKSQASRVIMIVDSCFSGQSADGQPLAPGLQALVRTSQLDTNGKTIRLTAGKSNQFAGPLPGAHRPAFSYLILGALRGWGDANHDSNVTAEEAVNYANDVLFTLAKDRKQTPELIAADKQAILAVNAAEKGPDIDAMLRTMVRERSGRRHAASSASGDSQRQPASQQNEEKPLARNNDNTTAAQGNHEPGMPPMKKAGIALTAAGGAALVTGAVFLGMYANAPEVCDGLSGNCQGKPGWQAAVGGTVGGIGAAALITGIVLMAKSKPDSNKTAFFVVPTAGGAAVSLSGRF